MKIDNIAEFEAALTRFAMLKNTADVDSALEIELTELNDTIQSFDAEHLQFNPET